MDLQAGERALAELEREAGRIKNIAAVRDELERATTEVRAALSGLERLVEGLQVQATELGALSSNVRTSLDSIHGQLSALVREVDQTVQAQLNRAMGSFETLVRAESRTALERSELRMDELNRLLDSKLAAYVSHASALCAVVNRNFWINIAVTIVIAVVIGALVFAKVGH